MFSHELEKIITIAAQVFLMCFQNWAVLLPDSIFSL